MDRPGLLSEITGALSDLSLDIASAHITTFGEKVIDTFYVTDLTNRQDRQAKQEAIRLRRWRSCRRLGEGRQAPVGGCGVILREGVSSGTFHAPGDSVRAQRRLLASPVTRLVNLPQSNVIPPNRLAR